MQQASCRDVGCGPQKPYGRWPPRHSGIPGVRDMQLLRTHQTGCGVLFGEFLCAVQAGAQTTSATGVTAHQKGPPMTAPMLAPELLRRSEARRLSVRLLSSCRGTHTDTPRLKRPRSLAANTAIVRGYSVARP